MDRELIAEIKNSKNEEEIKQIIDSVIIECLEALEEINIDTKVKNTLGVESDINYERIYLNENDKNDNTYNMQAVWTGFIPKTTKIIYGINIDKYKEVANQGSYYYIDDNSYLYEFSKFIKEKEIDTDEDFILYVYDFLNKYLGNILNKKQRKDIHKLIYKNENVFYKPIKEHSNKDFIGTGGAMCTEYATLAQNILTLYGFDMMYLMDDKHAYNLIFLNEKVHLLDLSMCVVVLDEHHNEIGTLPFLEEIENYSNELLKRVIYGDEKFILNQYFDIYINDRLFKFTISEKREYGVWGTREELLEKEETESERIIRRHQ